MVAEGLLQRVERSVAAGQALDCAHLTAVGLNRQHQASARTHSIHQNCAGAANAVFAAEMRSREMQLVAQKVAECHARLNGTFMVASINPQLDGYRRHAAALSRARARS
jgi:hypothetical protein